MATLFVGDLDPSVSESHVYNKFQENVHLADTIITIKICRDVITKHSLGYGYINFRTTGDADRALYGMNYELINGHPIRLMRLQCNPAIRKSGIGNVFVKNLDYTIDNKMVYDMFSACGNILSCKVALDGNNRSKGYGFVHFETEEEANRSIEKVNGTLLNGKKVYVGHFIPKNERTESIRKAKNFSNIYIKNLGDVTGAALRKLFEKFGPITSCAIMTDGDGKCQGFGFVAFQKSEDGKKAVEEMNGQELQEGKPLYVARAQTKIEREKELLIKYRALKQERMTRSEGSNLYIKNLEDGMDDEALRKKFEPYGTITSAKVMKNEKGCSKGFGFVCYSDSTEATSAVVHLNGRMCGKKPLYVGLAQRKHDRQVNLTAKCRARQVQRAYLAEYDHLRNSSFPFHSTPFSAPMDQQQMRSHGSISQTTHTNLRWSDQVAMAPAAPQNVANGNGAGRPHYSNGNGAVTAVSHYSNGNGAASHYRNGNGAVPRYANVNGAMPHYYAIPNGAVTPVSHYSNDNGTEPHYSNGNVAVTTVSHYPNSNGAASHYPNGSGAVPRYANLNGAMPHYYAIPNGAVTPVSHYSNGNGTEPHYSNGNGAVTAVLHYPNGNGAASHYPNGSGAVPRYANVNGSMPHYYAICNGAVTDVPHYSNGNGAEPHYSNGNGAVSRNPSGNEATYFYHPYWPVPYNSNGNGTGPNHVCGNDVVPQPNNIVMETQGRPVVDQNNGVIPQAQHPAASFSVPQVGQAIQNQSSPHLELASAEPDQQKQELGAALWPIVATMSPENFVRKIIGMLVELDTTKLVYFLENRDSLMEEVQLAVQLLQECHYQGPPNEDQSQRPEDESAV